MAQDSNRHWDKDRAEAYDKRVREAIPGYDALHVLSCQIVAEATGGKGRALVVGAGTGAECIALAQSCPNLAVVGVDPSKEMLAHAEAKVAEHGVTGRVRLYPAKVGDLPKFEPFDAATVLLVMHFLKDDGAKQSLLDEVAAHLKPGAPLVLAAILAGAPEPVLLSLHDYARPLGLAFQIENDLHEISAPEPADDLRTGVKTLFLKRCHDALPPEKAAALRKALARGNTTELQARLNHGTTAAKVAEDLKAETAARFQEARQVLLAAPLRPEQRAGLLALTAFVHRHSRHSEAPANSATA